MENLNLYLFLSFFAPFSMMLFVCEGKTRRILFFMLCGIVACLLCGYVNSVLLEMMSTSMDFFTINITPTIEEVCKAVPILIFAFVKERDNRSILECSVAVGVGFAILENAFTLSYNVHNLSFLLALVRGFGSGMMHGLSTLTVGLGMTFVHKRRKLFYTGTIALLSVSVMYHSLYNILVQSQYQIAGFVLPLLTFVPIVIVLKKRHKS